MSSQNNNRDTKAAAEEMLPQLNRKLKELNNSLEQLRDELLSLLDTRSGGQELTKEKTNELVELEKQQLLKEIQANNNRLQGGQINVYVRKNRNTVH